MHKNKNGPSPPKLPALMPNSKKRELPFDQDSPTRSPPKKRKQNPVENQMGSPIPEEEIDVDENIVGTGTFSKVYKGIYENQTVAVKIFKIRVSDADFTKEVLTLRKMKHEKIVKYIGYCLDGEQKKIIMEFMERGTLFDLLHKELQEFTWLEKLKIIKQVTEAMKYLHSQNIAHCDLSSKNLLVSKSFEIKISDFGQCEKMDETASKVEFPNGRLRGTLRWMSKEILQKESEHLDKCDVWSFGVIMFEIGASTIPYWDMTDADVRSEIKKGSYPVVKNFLIWMDSKIANKWKLLMDLCFQTPIYRPSFELLDADIQLLINSMENSQDKYVHDLRKK